MLKPYSLNLWYLAHFSNSKILLHQEASWIYPQVGHGYQWMTTQYRPGRHDLEWSGGESQYASFLCVVRGCMQSWWHFHCHIKRGTLSQVTPYSFKVCLIHNNWVHPLAAATYAAAVMERDMQFCFLEDQHTKDLPRNWHAPEVDFLSSLSPAQPKSV